MELSPLLDTPILFIVFNRPAPTRRAFEAIRAAKPRRLYIASDGPRPHKEGEATLVKAVREIATQVDWDAEVHTLFRDRNVGCKQGVAGAIDWFFQHEPEGIILEDDCVPSSSFFRFCQEMLARYRDDNRVMHIAGTNHHPEYVRDPDYSYYFSFYGHMWGWATWRRAWALYDMDLAIFPEITAKAYLRDLFGNRLAAQYFTRKVGEAYSGKLDTWDYQWDFIRMIHSGLTVVPNINLVENIGFGPDATHTFSAQNESAKNQASDIGFPLRHPAFVIRDAQSDNRHFRLLLKRILIRKILGSLRIKGYDTRG